MKTDKLKCMNIINGEMCILPEEGSLTKLMKDEKLVARKTSHKNGERVILETEEGNWMGTGVKYKDSSSFFLLKEK